MRGAIHHLNLTVKDPCASLAFYQAVLGFMGYRLVALSKGWCDFERSSGEGSTFVGLVAAKGWNRRRAHDRYSRGLHHLAFRAASREDVDALFALLVGLGATILDPPADYPDYGAGYYAVFFADADGLKLEYVFTP